MENIPSSTRPKWLELWLAFALAVISYRIASGAFFIFYILLDQFLGELVMMLQDYFDSTRRPLSSFLSDSSTVVGICCAVLAARWQEPYFEKKSRSVCIVAAVVITILAANPLRLAINPELVPVMVDPYGIP